MLSGDFSFGDPIGIGEPASLFLAVLNEVLFPLLVIIVLFQLHFWVLGNIQLTGNS